MISTEQLVMKCQCRQRVVYKDVFCNHAFPLYACVSQLTGVRQIDTESWFFATVQHLETIGFVQKVQNRVTVLSVTVEERNAVSLASWCYSHYYTNCCTKRASCFYFKVISYILNMFLVGVS